MKIPTETKGKAEFSKDFDLYFGGSGWGDVPPPQAPHQIEPKPEVKV